MWLKTDAHQLLLDECHKQHYTTLQPQTPSDYSASQPATTVPTSTPAAALKG